MASVGFGGRTGFTSLAASGGGSGSTVQPPSPTSQLAGPGTTSLTHTFGAFTDTGSVISSYVASIIAAEGTASVSGSGLGAYTISVTGGSSFSLLLNARDASTKVVATAVHAIFVQTNGSFIFQSANPTIYPEGAGFSGSIQTGGTKS
jgi:hypothetical protein